MENEQWWGQVEAGSDGGINGNELLIGVGVPDWTRLPTELGGLKVKVIGSHIGPCPVDTTHDARHLHLEGDVQVAECAIHKQFFWYRKTNE